jgi:dTDP-4-dehydrorhamnose reductase
MATRFLVTGAKGQLGTELMARLDPSHHDVVGVDLDNGEATLDITRRDLTIAAICEYEPDVIIHGAAFTAVDLCESQPDTAFLVNSLATRFIAEGARRVGAHVVYVSTDYVFDGTKDGPYLEWDAPNPRSVYGRSKLGGELELDRGWTVARTSWVCSAHGNNMVKTVLRVAKERDELSFVDDQYGHPTFAGDLADTLIRLGVERAAGVHHVTNQGAVSWFEFVQAIMSAAGHDPARVKPISTEQFAASRPADAPPMAPRPVNSVLDNFALRASGLGEMRDFREPLAEVVTALQ